MASMDASGYYRSRYRRLKRLGLCPRCRKKPEHGRVYCQKCLEQKRDAVRRKVGKPPKPPAGPEAPETPIDTPLIDLLEWLRDDPIPMEPIAGPVEQEEEEDLCALAPEIAEKAWFLRVAKGMSVEDKEGDEFKAWGPSPKSGRLVFSTNHGEQK